VDPSTIQWLVLTHAHLDHTGYIPRLINEGFRGQILATQATVDLAHLLLPDSGHLQEEDAAYANKKHFSKHEPALALYTYEDAVKSLDFFRAVDESKSVEVSSHFVLRFFPAGHILGARSIEVAVRENGTVRKVLFSGDLGRYRQLIIREPAAPNAADYLLVESTYGDRLHPTDDFRARLVSIAESTAARGGSVVIPAFAVGRTQELLYVFRELIAQGKMHSLPIYVDSPMAIDTTDLYRRHREDHNLEMDKLEAQGIKPFSPPDVHFARSVEESKALNDSRFPTIIISASGMATGGRVVHHLARCLPDDRNTILFVGFQAAGTRGQTIQSGARTVKMYGEQVPICAQIEYMENLSGHADYGEILRWLGELPKAPNKTFLVHGEPRAAQALKEKIAQQLHWEVSVATYLQRVSL
jgi:metallo-beta-lactamase family protein